MVHIEQIAYLVFFLRQEQGNHFCLERIWIFQKTKLSSTVLRSYFDNFEKSLSILCGAVLVAPVSGFVAEKSTLFNLLHHGLVKTLFQLLINDHFLIHYKPLY